MHFALDRQTAFPDPSLEPPNAVPCFSGPPQALQKPTLELPGPPQDTPESPQGPLRTSQIFKVDHQKPSQICVFGPQEQQENTFFNFWASPVPPGTHLGLRPCHPDPPQGAQKHPRALLGTSLGPPWTPLEHPCEFQHGHCFIEKRRLLSFTHIYNVFLLIFNKHFCFANLPSSGFTHIWLRF